MTDPAPHQDDLNEEGIGWLKQQFAEQAKWAYQIARAYENPERLLASAAVFDRLAATVETSGIASTPYSFPK